jgi:hypothetical protein
MRENRFLNKTFPENSPELRGITDLIFRKKSCFNTKNLTMYQTFHQKQNENRTCRSRDIATQAQ